MKRKIRTPYFEIGTKNYIYGDKVLEYAIAADKAAEKYDIDVLFITPAVEIRRVVENTKNLIVLAPYMDTLRPGRGMADILPEALKAAGAEGVVVNHCEKPMSVPQIKATIERANELDMLVFACADSVAETKALAQLGPDIINPEPSELIGGTSGGVSDMSYVKEVITEIKKIKHSTYEITKNRLFILDSINTSNIIGFNANNYNCLDRLSLNSTPVFIENKPNGYNISMKENNYNSKGYIINSIYLNNLLKNNAIEPLIKYINIYELEDGIYKKQSLEEYLKDKKILKYTKKN